jgi:hypothetical protein
MEASMQRLIPITIVLSLVGLSRPSIPSNASGQDDVRAALDHMPIFRAEMTRLEHMPVLRPDMSRIEAMPVLRTGSH